MPLRDLLNNVVRRRTRTYTDFSIGPDQILDEPAEGEAERFVPEETYLEIRLSQMFLRDEREGWRQFLPFASLLAEFQYAGERRTVPVAIGPELLAGVPQVGEEDRVEFVNIRAAGPYPYMGDDVELFFGLFRMQTTNWAKRVLTLLESITKAVDVTKLSSFINVSGPLVDGVEGLLGMDEVELRMAIYRHLATPPDVPQDRLPDTALRRGFHVLMGDPPYQIGPEEQRRFWVRDGRLWYGQTKDRIALYDEADFVLVRTTPLTTRFDYATFDFAKVHWKKVKEQIWNGQEDAARQALRLLVANLVQCEDLTLTHRNALLARYQREFKNETARYKAMFEEGGDELQGFEGAREEGPVDEETALREAVLAGPRPAATDPAALLATVDV